MAALPCLACDRPLPDGAAFCPRCGQRRRIPACLACGEPLAEAAAFCPRCGAGQDAATALRLATAPLARRLAAALLDAAVMVFGGSLLAVAIALPLLRVADRAVYTGAVYTLWLAAIWLYSAALESRFGATPGKRLLGLTVATEAGGRPSFAAASGRFVGKLILGVVGVIVVGLAAYALMLLYWDRRTFYDRAARTVVLRARAGVDVLAPARETGDARSPSS